MPRYILVNGAPRSGKDTIAKHFVNTYPKRSFFERFSRPHKEAFAAMACADIDEWFDVPLYERDKSAIIPWLGVSYRQWQIDFSEKFMKPLYGNDIFGRMLVDRTTGFFGATPIIIPDCGFQVEVDCLKDERCLLIRVGREGYTFENDSREYVEPAPGWTYTQILNNSTEAELKRGSYLIISKWLEKTQ